MKPIETEYSAASEHTFVDILQPGLAFHSETQSVKYLIAIPCVVVLLCSVYPLLAGAEYLGGTGLHAAIEIVSCCFGLITGLAFITRYYALGNPFQLFIGLAYFINGAGDAASGILSFRSVQQLFGLTAASHVQSFPGIYVFGRILLGAILFIAILFAKRCRKTAVTRKGMIWVSLLILFSSFMLTIAAFRLPLFFFPERLVSRPVDVISGLLLFVVLFYFLREYYRQKELLLWWISLSIAIHLAGQIIISFSHSPFDSFFDIAHIYKVLGNMVPMLGFILYQTASVTQIRRAGEKLQMRTHELGERVKELNCLYGIYNLLEKPDIPMDELLQGTVDLIPQSWRFPEIACARIMLGDREIKTKNFMKSKWLLTNDISIGGERSGILEVRYTEKIPGMGERPFLKEERDLLSAIADQLGHILSRLHAEERFQSLAEHIPDIVFLTDMEGTIIYTNRAHPDLKTEEVTGRTIFDLPYLTYQNAIKETFDRTKKTGRSDNCEVYGGGADGAIVYYHVRAGPVFQGGKIAGVVLTMTDITEHKKINEVLREDEERFRAMFDFAPISLWEEDFSELGKAINNLKQSGIENFPAYLEDHPEFIARAAKLIRVLDVNDATLKMYGAESKAELIGLLDKVFVPESYPAFKKQLIALAEGKNHFKTESVNRTLQDRRIDVLLSAAYPTEKEALHNVLVSITDITERKEWERKLESVSETDYLTKVYNRVKFTSALEYETARIIRYGDSLSIIMFDIDHFKRVNDSFGHDTGDNVLVMIAGLVKNQLRETDILSRWGGEEFMILLPNTPAAAAPPIAERIRNVIDNHIFENAGKITCSFGVTSYKAGESADDFLKRVDVALYDSKNCGRNRVTFRPFGA